MHSTNQPQTTSKSQGRDAAIQIISNQSPEFVTCHGCIHLQDQGDGVGWCNFHYQFRNMRIERECEGAQFFEDQAMDEQTRQRQFKEVNELIDRKRDELDKGPDGAGNMWHWSPEERVRRVQEILALVEQLKQLAAR